MWIDGKKACLTPKNEYINEHKQQDTNNTSSAEIRGFVIKSSIQCELHEVHHIVMHIHLHYILVLFKRQRCFQPLSEKCSCFPWILRASGLILSLSIHHMLCPIFLNYHL